MEQNIKAEVFAIINKIYWHGWKQSDESRLPSNEIGLTQGLKLIDELFTQYTAQIQREAVEGFTKWYDPSSDNLQVAVEDYFEHLKFLETKQGETK